MKKSIQPSYRIARLFLVERPPQAARQMLNAWGRGLPALRPVSEIASSAEATLCSGVLSSISRQHPVYLAVVFALSVTAAFSQSAGPDARQIRSDSLTTLKEGWDFHFKAFLLPGRQPDNPKAETVNLPFAWNTDSKTAGLPARAYASFRKLIDLAPQKSWGLKLGFVHTAYRLYINGELKVQRGIPSDTLSEHREGFRPALVYFASGDKPTEILLHVANAYHENAGILTDIVLGPAELIAASHYRSVAIDVFLLGTVVIMSLYHFSLFYTRRVDKSSLYFALFCLFILMRAGFAGEKCLAILLPWLPDPLIGKLEFMSIYTGVPVFVLFARSLYRELIPNYLLKTCLSIGALYTCITIVAPNHVYANLIFERVYYFLSLGFFSFVIRAFALAARQRQPGAIQGFAGFVIFFMFMVNDLFHDLKVIHTGYFIPVGFYFFVFSQAFNLSVRFSKAFEQQEAYISLQKDIELAKGIQKNLLPSQRPALPGLESFVWYRAAQQISGDFYDYKVNPPQDFIRLLVADVSGHGVPAAMLATMGKLAFSIESKESQSPAEVLRKMNERLLGQMGSNFMTAQCIDLDLTQSRVSVASAGHNMAYRLRRETGTVMKIPQQGLLLGQFPTSGYRLWSDNLLAGDRFLIVTDGLLEAAPIADISHAEQLLLGWLMETGTKDLQRAGTELIGKFVAAFPMPPDDDQTLVLLEYTGATD